MKNSKEESKANDTSSANKVGTDPEALYEAFLAGKNLFLRGESEKAADILDDVVTQSAELYGQLGAEMAPRLYYYGSALLESYLTKSSVFGESVPG